MVGGCTYRDRLALVVHDRPGDRGLLRKAATSGELAAGLRLSPRRRAASWGRGGDPAGALFMDVRPPKNSPRTSNVSTSVSVGAYASDDESDDAVDDQKGRRRQPEKSDEARAVHTLRCLYRGSEGAPPSRAQVQRPKKKDLSYFRLTIRGRAPPRGPRSSRGGRLPS